MGRVPARSLLEHTSRSFRTGLAPRVAKRSAKDRNDTASQRIDAFLGTLLAGRARLRRFAFALVLSHQTRLSHHPLGGARRSQISGQGIIAGTAHPLVVEPSL
jgi:hypothetical protein